MSLTLEKLNEDLALLNQRKEQALQGFHQILGAISIVQQMIERLKEDSIQQDTLARQKEEEVMRMENEKMEQEDGQVDE